MGKVLQVENLFKSYKRRPVLRGVSLHVSPGEIVGLLGPNGAGKTTCFNIIVGLLWADQGLVRLGTYNLASLPLYRRARLGLGYLPQAPTVFQGLSVEANLRAILEIQKVAVHQRQERVESLLDRYHLSALRHHLGSELSGGERRRLEMARTLACEPEVVLLDEPFAGVDPRAVSEMHGFIRAVRQADTGVLLTDHNVRETLGICDRAYVISEGRILMTGCPQEMVAHQQARQSYLGEDFKL